MVSRRTLVKSWKYKLNLFKIWFEKGYSILSYPKWVLAMYGIGELASSRSYFLVAGGSLLFLVVCTVVGYFWLKKGLFLAEQEVGNQYNLFQRELRKKLKT